MVQGLALLVSLERSHSQEETENWTTRKRVEKKRRNSSHIRSKLDGGSIVHGGFILFINYICAPN